MNTASYANLTVHPGVTPFLDADTNTISYVAKDPASSGWSRRTSTPTTCRRRRTSSRYSAKVGIGNSVAEVQETFGKVFNEGTEFRRDGSQFDRLFADGDSYRIGAVTAFAMHTPGHAPACVTHVVGDAAFVGDTLFMPDSGTARADFQRTAQRIT
jgi:metallo-beta-lactamase superfamily protein